MSQHDFRFKQFLVRQDHCAMKVGTDGVLLGAWVDPSGKNHILDVGTGTGLIALMMAQKSNAAIDAIDIDENAFRQAAENFSASPWKDRLTSLHRSLQDFCSSDNKYDLIVSNPPYFMGAHPAPSEARNIARHMDDTLSIEELTFCVKKLLAPGGIFCVILPFMEGEKFRAFAEANGLFATHLTKVKTKMERQEKRLMMIFSLIPEVLVENELVIQEADLSFTEQYIELTKDFYLGLPKKR